MSKRLTDIMLVELIASFESAIAEQRAQVPADVQHLVERTFATADWIFDGLTELRARRSADLSKEDVEALKFTRKVVWASRELFIDRRKTDKRIGVHVDECDRALAVIDRLLAVAEGEV